VNWLNPLALAGLFALGIPILVHLFGRRLARRQRFPSLRLLGEATPTPVTRSVPSDVLLLVVRCAVVLAAVLALAQPVWPTASRARAAGRPVRVILVDTSASMHRLTSNGTAVDVARSIGRALLDSARNGLLIESSNPGASLAGAASWLEPHAGLREVVVVSDFQVGAMFEGHAARVPPGIGLRFVRVAGAPEVTGGTWIGLDSVQLDSGGTTAAWQAVRADSISLPTVLGSSEELAEAEHSLNAVRGFFRRNATTTDRVAVVFPGDAGRGELVARARALDSAWQGNLLVALRRDPVLSEVLSGAQAAANCEVPGTPIAHNDSGLPVASIVRSGQGVQYPLLIFSCAESGSLAAIALVARVSAHLDAPRPVHEREPLFVPDERLSRWQREPTASAPRGIDETSPDGKWLWLIALVLLGLEELLRRRAPRRVEATKQEVARARVA
jgi:hypothetical protein